MATIKSYTDLQQSKKLAEILPIESADCFWDYDDLQKYHRINWFEDGYEKDSQLRLNKNDVCAWSLAALLGVFEYKGFFYKLYFDGVSNVLEVINIDNPNIHEANYNDYSIDACVAMIEKLYELNLL